MPSKFLAQMADFLGHLRKWGWVEDGEFSLAENAFIHDLSSVTQLLNWRDIILTQAV